MRRKRPKTEADRPTYRAASPRSQIGVPPYLAPFLAGRALRRIVEQYGMSNVQTTLNAIVDQGAD